MGEKSPVFIKIDEYKEVLDTIDNLKKELGDVRLTLEEIKKLRTEEEQTLDDWETNVHEAEAKLLELDKSLFEPDA